MDFDGFEGVLLVIKYSMIFMIFVFIFEGVRYLLYFSML